MPRDIVSLLRYEAKRNGQLAQLVENVGFMTEAEIKAAKVKLPWMRQALLTLKDANAYTDLAATVEDWVLDYASADPMGETRRWIGGDRYIKVGRSQIEIVCGQLVWSDGNGVWVDTIHSPVIDPLLYSQTESCGRMTRSAYMQAVRDRTNGLTGVASAPLESNGAGHHSPLFRLYRPG